MLAYHTGDPRPRKWWLENVHLGPVVQSVVSLTSSLRAISLTILADSIYNFSEIFCWKNVSSFCTAKMVIRKRSSVT